MNFRVIACALFLSVACSGCFFIEAVPEELSDAETAWSLEVAENGNTYWIMTGYQSFTGYETHTTTQVLDGFAIARYYVATQREGGSDSAITVVEAWAETREDLGSHATGDAARTMSELHQVCSGVLDRRDREDVTMTVDEAGVMETCFSVPRGCFDDCASGVFIEERGFGLYPVPE